jgi:peptidoglycan hydrolase-like protein with peptidoglycan-binding domain
LESNITNANVEAVKEARCKLESAKNPIDEKKLGRNSKMASSGIERIDNLFDGLSQELIVQGDADRESVGAIQDLLIGHGFTELPGLLGKSRGTFGPKTTDAVRSFQQKNGLTETGAVDPVTLRSLISTTATRPLASRVYLTLVLDFLFSGMTRLMSFTTQFEGAGLFGAINRNTDKAGLSFGLIQWAQKPGRLNELLRAFQESEPEIFLQVLGAGDPAIASGLIAHTAKTVGGVNNLGQTTDSKFNLTAEPWVGRFRQAALNRNLQQVQVREAVDAFTKSFERLRGFAPQLKAERSVAFMLDLANQHGDGGAKSIFNKVAVAGLSEPALLQRIEGESVARVTAQFANNPNGPAIIASTRNRREAFRTSALLSDEAFNPV